MEVNLDRHRGQSKGIVLKDSQEIYTNKKRNLKFLITYL